MTSPDLDRLVALAQAAEGDGHAELADAIPALVARVREHVEGPGLRCVCDTVVSCREERAKLTERAETKRWYDDAQAALRQEREARAKLHALIDQARNFIDPEEHPTWDADASRELVRCDERAAAADALAEAAEAVAGDYGTDTSSVQHLNTLRNALAAYEKAKAPA